MGECASPVASDVGLSNSHICTPPTVSIAPCGRFIQLKRPAGVLNVIPRGPRGRIVTFSPASRKRLMQLFASLDSESVSKDSVFVTLTYPGSWPADPAVWHDQLRRFCQKLQRKFPKVSMVWRLEFQTRGAPHFHLMCLGERFIPKDDIRDWWASIAHVGDQYQGKAATRIERPHGWRQACKYLSKYMAKPGDAGLDAATGRLWGVRNREMLPQWIDTQELTDAQFSRIKHVLWVLIPADCLPPGTLTNQYGLWTMIDGLDAQRIVTWALNSEAPAYDYWLSHMASP